MTIWKRLKNLWRLSGIEQIKASTLAQKMVEEFVQDITTPPRPATIVEDELPDIFEQDDTTTQ